jgi:hypothetical protein
MNMVEVKPDNSAMKQRLSLTRELVLGSLMVNTSFQQWLGKFVASLPQYIDDAQRDFGCDVYERMERDPNIASNILGLKMSVLSEGPRLMNRIPAPSISDDEQEQARFKKGEEIQKDIQGQLDKLAQPFDQFLMEVMDFLVYGHVLAEKTYEVRKGKLALKKITIKPKKSYRFVVSPYMDFLGVTAATNIQSGSVVPPDSLDPKDLIEREKFFHIGFAPRGGDPRGSSLIRAAYTPWFIKQTIWPQYVKYLSQFGTPSIAATLPEGVNDTEQVDEVGEIISDSNGNPKLVTAAEALLAKGINITFITDAAIFQFAEKADAALIGADIILKDQSAVNKTGSCLLALSCRYYDKPFYVLAGRNKFSVKKHYKSQYYPEEEVWDRKHPKLKVVNTYFERIPAELITGILSNNI